LEPRKSQGDCSVYSSSSKASSDPTHDRSSESSKTSSVDDGCIGVSAAIHRGRALSMQPDTWVPPSTGSALHFEGGCSPCFFFAKKSDCRAGIDCKFCHMAHEVQARARPSKQRRAQAKKVADAVVRHSPEVHASTLIEQSLASASDESQHQSYLHRVILCKLKPDAASSPSSGRPPNLVSL